MLGPGPWPKSGYPPQGRPTPQLAGNRPKHRRAPTQELVLLSGTSLLLLVNLDGALMCFFHWASIEREVVLRIWAVAEVLHCVSEIVGYFALSIPRGFPGREVFLLVWHSAFPLSHSLPFLFLTGTSTWYGPIGRHVSWSRCAGPVFRDKAMIRTWCPQDETTGSGQVLVLETLLSIPPLCVGHDDELFITTFAMCCCLRFSSSSQSLCLTLTCLFPPHRVSAHHADFKDPPSCNH